MKHVFIISQDGDPSADEIMHWVAFLTDAKIIRINDTDEIRVFNIFLNASKETTFSIQINNEVEIHSTQIQAFWYRRGGLKFTNIALSHLASLSSVTKKALDTLNTYYRNEWEHSTDFIYYLLKNGNFKTLNSYFDLHTNKLINLEIAKRAGLNIPDSIVTNCANTLQTFINLHKTIIVKPIRYPGTHFFDNDAQYYFSQKTNLFTENDLKNVLNYQSHFQPTLFQEYIDKEFEIRSFYIRKRIYSMAIFSQSNEKTKIDFRDYDYNKPNRIVPFVLSKNVEMSLCHLMQELKYDTGSIDAIYNNGKYTFLEVNTVGQFQWLSKACNYYIEKEIAYDLTESL